MKVSAQSPSSKVPIGLRLLCALTMLVTGSAAVAADVQTWHVHGFLSQAAFYTSDNNFDGDSDDGISTDFNEAGLNGSLNLPANLRLSGQLLARNAGHYDNGALRTDYFNLDWQFWSSADIRAGVRVGRVRNAYGLFNETRDVAHTRPGITLPILYLEQARDLNISRDGIGFYSDVFTSHGTLAVEIGTGKARVSNRLVKEALMADGSGIEPDDARISMLSVNWEDADGHWRFAASQFRITSDVTASLDVFLPGFDVTLDGNFELDTTMLSVQYSTERWQLTAEWLRFDYDLDFGHGISRRYPGEGAYAQYTWIFSPAWQLYGRYEDAVMDRHHRNGSAMEQFCGTALDKYCTPRTAGFRRDASIGLRWDINSQWMLATEAHYIEGTMGLPYSDNPIPADLATYWTLFGIELAFRF